MKKLLHNIEIKVFEKDESQIHLISKSFSLILPIDFEKEKIVINKTQVKGLENDTIHIFSIKINKNRHNLLFIKKMFKKLNKKDIEKIYKQRNSRLNDHGIFFIRIDKTSLFKNIYKITELGDCFHIKIKLAAFPNKREIAMKSLEKLIEIFGSTSIERQ
jgi:RNA binding exosome subunit